MLAEHVVVGELRLPLVGEKSPRLLSEGGGVERAGEEDPAAVVPPLHVELAPPNAFPLRSIAAAAASSVDVLLKGS